MTVSNFASSCGAKNRFRVTPKIGAGHRDDMRLVAGDEMAEMHAELVVGIGGDMVEFIHRDQPVVESLNPKFVDGEAKGRMGADQHLDRRFPGTRRPH